MREPVAATDNTGQGQAPVTMALKPESENNINIVTNLTTIAAVVTVEHRFSNKHFQRYRHIGLKEASTHQDSKYEVVTIFWVIR